MVEKGHGGQRWIVDDGQQQVVLTLRGSAWHDGLVIGCFVCGLGGVGARQCWAADWCWLNVWTNVSGPMTIT